MSDQSLQPILMTPGPVALHPKVRESLSWPMIHHRTKQFEDIFVETLSQLRLIFQTEQPCFILSSSGSGGMEALLVNTTAPGDRILVINSGKFGERWLKMAQRLKGTYVYNLEVPWGEAVCLNTLEALLNKEKPNIILTQACETSTGVWHPIESISDLIKKHCPNALLLVDGITALGATHVPMDLWGIDGLVGGSQKGFMLPTGLAFVSLSQRAWHKAEKITSPSYYFDLKAEKEANKKGQSNFSAPVTLIRSLNIALKIILDYGIHNYFQRVETIANHTRKCLQLLGLEGFTQSPSPTLSTFRVTQADRFRQFLEDQYQVTIMSGQDHLKDQIIRIGHMGYLTAQNVKESLFRIKNALQDLSYPIKNESLFTQEVEKIRLPDF
ncbi:MAG: alanine--glyoxylate aminotransferase family protein [Bdellovibrionaceae bacterium]|nr:alanine--glyoxylate aminotransferase family protein [Pseudobdellovibrionaceae bacterium]MDW8191279.1 alanine--glyoxylate aminotransferase family protein [Pseudobdellovibrionaceae bacterium]